MPWRMCFALVAMMGMGCGSETERVIGDTCPAELRDGDLCLPVANLCTDATAPESCPRIEAFVPASEQQGGRILELTGQGFATPPELNTVTVGGVAATTFYLSTSVRLRVEVPALPEAPAEVWITLETVAGRVSKPYRVLAAWQASGVAPTITSVTADSTGAGSVGSGMLFSIGGSGLFASSEQLRVVLRSREPSRHDYSRELELVALPSSDLVRSYMPPDVDLVEELLFPGGPVRPDDMEVEVWVADHNPVYFPLTVYRLTDSPPVITGTEPSSGAPFLIGSDLTLVGTGFAAAAADNEVNIDGVGATVVSASETALAITVPSGIAGLNQSGDTRTVLLTLRTPPGGEAWWMIEVERP